MASGLMIVTNIMPVLMVCCFVFVLNGHLKSVTAEIQILPHDFTTDTDFLFLIERYVCLQTSLFSVAAALFLDWVFFSIADLV